VHFSISFFTSPSQPFFASFALFVVQSDFFHHEEHEEHEENHYKTKRLIRSLGTRTSELSEDPGRFDFRFQPFFVSFALFVVQSDFFHHEAHEEHEENHYKTKRLIRSLGTRTSKLIIRLC